MRADRRAFLAAGGGLVVAFAIAPRAAAQGAGGEASVRPGPQLPGSLKTQPMLDGWIRIAPDGAITVFTGKAELGQGIKTALIPVSYTHLTLPTKA